MEILYFDVDPNECRELQEIMKPDEVADLLCIHKNTLYNDDQTQRPANALVGRVE